MNLFLLYSKTLGYKRHKSMRREIISSVVRAERIRKTGKSKSIRGYVAQGMAIKLAECTKLADSRLCVIAIL